MGIKYQGYVDRQLEQVKKYESAEEIKIPDGIDFQIMPGLSNEVKEKLSQHRPQSIGQAMRISGVTPASMTALMIGIKKQKVSRETSID